MAGSGRASLNQSRRNQRTATISPAASVEEVLRIMKWWHDNGDGSIPAKPKSQAHRLLSEIHNLNEASLEILDELRPVAPATASLLRYRYEPTHKRLRCVATTGRHSPTTISRTSRGPARQLNCAAKRGAAIRSEHRDAAEVADPHIKSRLATPFSLTRMANIDIALLRR